jgi:hypothetical protein
VALPAQASADLQSVHPRHENVEDDRVRLAVLSETLEGLLPVGCKLDVVALELEGAAKGITHRAFVVDNQDPHGSIVRFQPEKRLRMGLHRS